MGGAAVRVSIPNSVRKTIQDLKEITGNHSDDEIYAALKECNMDPNETVQKLLLQVLMLVWSAYPFHEVKRKRDKRKEIVYKREPAEPRWRPGMQGKGSRSVRGNFSPRHIPHDAGGGKNSGPGIENGPAHVIEKDVAPSLSTFREMKTKEKSLVKSSVSAIVRGPTNVASGTAASTAVPAWQLPTGTSRETSSSLVGDNSGSVSSVDAKKVPASAFGNEVVHGQAVPSSKSSSVQPNLASTLGTCFSSSDPVLVPYNDLRVPGSVGTIKREAANHHPPASLGGSSIAQGKTISKTEGVGKPQPSDLSLPSTSTHGGLVSQPPSDSSQPQQLIGTQKVGTNKEWKPKPVVSTVAKGQATASPAASEVPSDLVEISSQPQPVTSVLVSEEGTLKLQKKLEELHFPQLPQRKLVILPNHIHVPESERNKLCFGSFGPTFGVANIYANGPESEKSSTPQSETSQLIEEPTEEQSSSNQQVSATADASDFSDHPQSPAHILENLSNAEGDVSSRGAQGHNESKPDTVTTSGSHQLPAANTIPNYSYELAPPVFGSPLAAFENSESQARDVSRLPNFVVQQAFDPASYYAQFYRSAADNDGRLSPFSSSGVSTKYNGNVGVLPPTSQSPQEGGVLSAGGSTPLVTQAPGSQQPIPVFRPPAGMHISHYPSYLHPYGPYFNPFYMPPPIHQYLGNGVFPQQPQAGGVYPPPPAAAAAAAGVKYSLPQYKAGTNTGNSNHMGMATGYGPYGSSPTGYSPSPATTAGNTTVNDDLSTSQFKDNNIYITGQQGQHMFTPTQACHGTYAGLYHPAQAVSAVHPLMLQTQTMAGAVDMVGPGGNVYQQPQHAQQMNWPNNY